MNASMTAFVDEVVKIGAAGQAAGKVGKFLMKNWKYPTIGAAGIGAYVTGKQAKDDWSLGRAVRKQHEQRGG